ncbi:MAG: FAD-dependent oxidoreductase [Bacteroidales bacterium]|nr:FAD-dependent oxidoreductase [Bacteroidales bacterium]
MDRRVFLKNSAAGALALALAPGSVRAASLGRSSVSGDFSKAAPVAGTYDVVVCGGGPAGFIAATASARHGAKTALIERYGFLGGMATMGYVAPISEFAFNGERVIGGIPWEFVKRLEDMGGAFVEWPKGNVDFDIELYKLCAQRLVLEAGVDLYMHSSLIACETEGNRICRVIIENKNGLESLQAGRFIDATGDGDLAWLAGVPMQTDGGGELQPSSFCFVLSGVDTDSELMQRYMYHSGKKGSSECKPIREKLLTLKAKGADLPDFGGPWFNSVMHKGSVAVNITRASADSTDNRDFTSAELRLREDIFKFTGALRKIAPEFKDCYVSSTAPQAGIRESRRILGVHTVTADEYVSGMKYEDSISRGAHQIDMHASKGSGQVLVKLQQAAYVPYRALIAGDFPNLLVAGRCISADRKALASLRVQASCMSLGQAAGVAAAQSLKEGRAVQDIDTGVLVQTLRNLGALI